MTVLGPLQAQPVHRLPRRSRRYAEGRVCCQPGCQTQLSAYNQAATCFLHTPVVIPRLRGRKPGRLDRIPADWEPGATAVG